MKKHYISITFLAVIVIVFISLFTGCAGCNTPPDISSVQKKFENTSDNIQTIVNFMIDSGYENVYITSTDGTMLADLTKMQINDTKVSDAVNQILRYGKYIKIIKIGNTISLLQWTGIQDIECGIAYTINGIDPPEVEFMTELVSLSEDGWFYYVADYNSWRTGKRVSLVEL